MGVEHAQAAQGIEQWRDAIEANPDVTWRILADIVKIVQSDAGPRRTGRRPAAESMGFERLWETVYPERFTMDPFPMALKALMGRATQDEFAPLMHVSQPQLSRLLSGRKDPDLALMEAAARAAGVTPAYFAEWRALKIAALISDLYLRRPNLSIIAVKQMARGVRSRAQQAGR